MSIDLHQTTCYNPHLKVKLQETKMNRIAPAYLHEENRKHKHEYKNKMRLGRRHTHLY